MNCKLYKVLLSVTAFALSAQLVSAQRIQGFVQQENVKVAGVTTDSALYSLSVTYKQTSRTYIDGLGRGIQTLGIQASPSQYDMIQPVAYDKLGRPVAAYLPYAGKSTDTIGRYRPNAVSTDQPAFYNQTTQYLIPVDTAPHANSIFENTPLQRLLKSGVVGNGYQPEDGGTQHYKTLNHRYNKSATDGNILIWNHDGTFTSANYYADNTLMVDDVKDEDNVETLIFTDEAGHTILKRQILSPTNLDTYYIYNWAGMLMYIVPPAATNVLSVNSYTLTASPLMNMVFYYTYDNQGRIVSRKVPAKGTMSVIYDPLSRPVLSQDANMAMVNQWSFVKYDVKGRAIESGIYTDGTTGRTTPSGMQSYVGALSYTTWYESRSSTLTNNGYYTSTVFPVAGTGLTLTPLSYAYFDDYDMNYDASHVADFSYSSQGLTGEATPTTAQLKGMPTMTSQTTVGNGLTNTWLTKVTFYDKRLNPIQTQSNNHVYYQAQETMTDNATVIPDFVGVPQTTYVTKKTTSTAIIQVLTQFTYDHMYRILNVKQAYNAGPTGTTTQVAAYTYSELGVVVKKGLGYVNSTTWLQNVEMRYNIRGQLMSINNSKLTPDGGVTMASTNTNAVFGAVYSYDLPDSNLGTTTPSYDGKVSSVKWMSVDGSGAKSWERAYKYTYDGVNRYTAAAYLERTTTGTGSFNNNLGGFDENGITFDLNGNIKTMKRNSSTQGTNSHVQIDSLVYTYGNSSIPDQLTKVTDGTGANYTGAGFRNLTASSGTYSYDNNGNLTADPYKGITLSYDYLNRTDKITVTTATNRYIYYTYDASGKMIRKQVYDNNLIQNTTDYVDGFVYITPAGGSPLISYFPMPEGRVLNTSTSSVTLVQEYIITDQQGNARVSFKNNGSNAAVVTQENSYYGFGLVMPNSPVGTTSTSNKQLYNGGSEWQNDYSNLPDYYQTYYRNYDAAIARWVGVDPMAEATESMTVYHYSGNNPIMFNDPLGNKIDPSKSPWNDPTRQKDMTPNANMQMNMQDNGNSDNMDGFVPFSSPIQQWANGLRGSYYSNSDAYWGGYIASGRTFGGPTISLAGGTYTRDPNGSYSSTWNNILQGSGYSVNHAGQVYEGTFGYVYNRVLASSTLT
ncbi:MAG: DUF6443 domain-containing protein [Mucilaginibacter sp.]